MKLSTVIGFLRAASLVMLLVFVALLAAITTMHFAIHGAEVQVPVLKGMTVADARSETSGLKLNLAVDNRYYSSDIAAGHILAQSPAPGTVVRSEFRVRIAESLGPQKVDVPNIVGKDERAAALELRRVGLEVGDVSHLPYSKAAEGTVLAQDPPAHAQGIARPSVNLLIATADPDGPDGIVMPDMTGLPIVGAQAQLAQMGLKVDTPTYVAMNVSPVGSGMASPVPPVRAGTVIAQSPVAGARVDRSALIRLTATK